MLLKMTILPPPHPLLQKCHLLPEGVPTSPTSGQSWTLPPEPHLVVLCSSLLKRTLPDKSIPLHALGCELPVSVYAEPDARSSPFIVLCEGKNKHGKDESSSRSSGQRHRGPSCVVPPTNFPKPPRCLHSIHKIPGLREIPFLPPKIALSHSSYPLEPSAKAA